MTDRISYTSIYKTWATVSSRCNGQCSVCSIAAVGNVKNIRVTGNASDQPERETNCIKNNINICCPSLCRITI